MLYPDFEDLISYKGCKFGKTVSFRRKVQAAATGNHSSPFRGQGLDFDAVREYVPGDDIRNIDWRVTARTGLPHLKLFKEEKERHTMIAVDMNSAMRFGTRNTFKSIQAARAASLLGWRALAHQDRISACFFGDVPDGIHYFSSKRSRQTLSSMLKMLTEPPEHQIRVPIETALQHICRVAPPGALIYLISDFMELSAIPCLNTLAKRCNVVFISINDAVDLALLPAGIIGFFGEREEKTYINTDSVIGREAYSAKWNENRKALNTLTERFKIPLIELSTESDIYRDLILGLKKCRR